MAEEEIKESGKTKKQLYDEAKAKRQAEKEKELAKASKQALKDAKKNTYHNPVYSLPGRIIIISLAVLMFAGIVISLVFVLINALK